MDHIERLVDCGGAHTPTPLWSRDAVAYLSSANGTPTVTVAGLTSGDGEREVSPESVRATFVTSDPSEDTLVFGLDPGGAERTQLYCHDLTTGESRPLLGEGDEKYRWGGWSPDGERFAVTSTRGEGDGFDVFVGRRDGSVTRVAECGGWTDVVAWTNDARRLVVRETERNLDHTLTTVHVDSGDRTRLTPPGDAKYTSTVTVPGGGVYTVTDYDADSPYLASISADGTVRRHTDHDHQVEGLCLGAAGERLAYGRNVRGVTNVSVADVSADGISNARRVETPGEGVIGEVSLSADGRLCYTYTDRTHGTDVYVTDTATGGRRRLTHDGEVTADERVIRQTPTLERVTATDGTELDVLYTVPEVGTDPYPVVIDLHGGPERQRRPSFRASTAVLVGAGFAVVEPNVRGSTGRGSAFERRDDRGRRWAAVHDVSDVADWITRQPWSDETVSLFGTSYGGLLVGLALARYPESFERGAVVSGIAHLPTFLRRTDGWRRSIREREYGSLADDEALLESLSPMNRIDSVDSPVYVAHGENDPRVPVEDARQFAAALAENGVPVSQRYFESEGHGVKQSDNRIQLYEDLLAFFDGELPR